jgi:hypothetical protein
LDTEALSEALKKNPEEVISIFYRGQFLFGRQPAGACVQNEKSMTEYQKTASNSITSTERKIDGYRHRNRGIGGAAESLAEKYYKKVCRHGERPGLPETLRHPTSAAVCLNRCARGTLRLRGDDTMDYQKRIT